MHEKALRGGKSGSRSPSGSAGTAPRRCAFGLVFRVVLLFFSWRVLGCGERSEPHLSMPSTRHGAKEHYIYQV